MLTTDTKMILLEVQTFPTHYPTYFLIRIEKIVYLMSSALLYSKPSSLTPSVIRTEHRKKTGIET